MLGRSRSGPTLLAAFSNTAHAESAKTRGTRVNTIGAEQKLCPFFVHFSKQADGVAALQMRSIVLILMPVLIFHFSGAERGSLIPAFTNKSSTDSWRGLPTRRSQMRKSSAVQTSPLIDHQHHLLCTSRHLCSEAANLRLPRSPFLRSPCIVTIMGL